MKTNGATKRTGKRATAVVLALGALLVPALLGSCTGEDTNASVRSLERAGRAAFVCLGAPFDTDDQNSERDIASSLQPLSACTNERRETNSDFGSDDLALHVYALITLETRGEVAVVDLTSKESNVLDQDTVTPGETSLPVGAQPIEIAATPNGTAAFVASADVTRPGLYALPSELMRPCESDRSGARCDDPPATIASWPACRLSSVPGAMVMVADPANNEGAVRTSCDGDYEPRVNDRPTLGDIDSEGHGRQKLYVTLPREGSIVVIDAQALLERDAGSFDDCTVERSLVLSGDAAPQLTDEIEQGPGCAVPEQAIPRASGAYPVTPAGLALVQPIGGTPGATGARLYIADLTAPKIHNIDLSNPCEPRKDEIGALLPTSSADPTRAVFTDRLAVSGITPSKSRYLYAIDFMDKSVMAFDVSDGANLPEPLRTAHPELNPFQPGDRVRFGAAPVDVMILERDDPESIAGGVTPLGTLCDPNPNAKVCSSESTECDLGTLYRTSADYEVGAGPFTLRGVFAMVALASGELAVIDIEDFDAPCRGPKTPSEAAGCDAGFEGGQTSNEQSCGVVIPHEPRSAVYLLSSDDVGRHEPGIQSFPVLSQEDGTVIGEAFGPTLVGVGEAFRLAVGGDILEGDDIADGVASDEQGPRNTLFLNLANPRVHQADQDWAITYQGALPGFEERVADLRMTDGLFVDSTTRFCELGVQSEEAVRALLTDSGATGDIDAEAVRLADRVFINEPLAPNDSDYWGNAACSFEACRGAFGPPESPTTARDLRITEAFDDRLEIATPADVTADLVECCFPTLVDYEVRPGDEWVLVGGASGFVHSTIATPGSGECRPSCDSRLERRKSRIRYSFDTDEDKIPFVNALFSLAIVVKTTTSDPAKEVVLPARDMSFRFRTQAAFTPIRGQLTSDDRLNVQAQQLGYVPATDEIFVTDGALEGMLLVPGDLVGDIRQFF